MESAVKPSPRLIPIGNIDSNYDGLLSESKLISYYWSPLAEDLRLPYG